MSHPLQTVRYVKLVDKLHIVLGLAQEYLELKIKEHKEKEENVAKEN